MSTVVSGFVIVVCALTESVAAALALSALLPAHAVSAVAMAMTPNICLIIGV